ncbi:MAG: TlpA family protein disulfide reductase [Candidatus Nanopelagicaceae bacterium]|jgi:thiol-disulfide isomerase/thioredoxin
MFGTKRLLWISSFVVVASLLLFSSTDDDSASEPSGQLSYIEGNGAVTKVSPGSRVIAPAISGELIDGNFFQSKRGQVLVINVWASWCSPCRAEAPTLQALSEKFPDVQFLGILTRDNLTAAQSFVERFNITFPSLRDDAILLEFNDSLIASAIPTTLVIDSKGRIAARIGGEVTFTGLSALIEEVRGEKDA